MTAKLSIGGVPEHFNLPWQLAIEQNIFQAHKLDVAWQYFKGGTGEMVNALKSGELDLAILLTEGFLSAAANGLAAVIVKEYVSSPLVWGIFTGVESAVNSVYDSYAKRIAISRLGSGSHLMALIHAEQRGENLDNYKLVEIKSLQGAIDSLTKNESDIFYWEKYMTKPNVVSGELRTIGEFSAPWSSFLIVANRKSYEAKKEIILQTISVMEQQCRKFVSNKNTVSELEKRFSMTKEDAQTWLSQTVWNTRPTIRKQGLLNAASALQKISADFLQLPKLENLIADNLKTV
ncbi:MAG TPA: ABC transporter substrate-binding protein [Chitinophagales bacterium]